MDAVVSFTFCGLCDLQQPFHHPANSVRTFHCVWNVWSLDVPALLPEEAWGRTERRLKCWICLRNLFPSTRPVCSLTCYFSFFQVCLVFLVSWISDLGFYSFVCIWGAGPWHFTLNLEMFDDQDSWNQFFSTLWEHLFFFCSRPFINPISAIFEKIFCWQRGPIFDEGPGVELGKPLPGSDAVEASRRRYVIFWQW